MADQTPDPHRDEPIPQTQEGLRPEADPSVVRPEQDEPNGPLTGLVATAAAELTSEVSDSPEAEEQLDDAGVEEEGIEGGQIMGIALAILVSVALMAFVVYWGFYKDALNETQTASETVVEELPDGRRLRAEAMAVMGDYSMAADSTYRLPIGVAMESVAAGYAGGAADAALEGEVLREDMPRAATRAGFNVAPVHLHPARAVRSESDRGVMTAPVPGLATDQPVDIELGTGEEVGIDGAPELLPDPTPEAEE